MINPQNGDIVVKTDRSGDFCFRIGLDMTVIQPLIERVEDAHALFAMLPMPPQIVREFEREVMVSGVFGTNTIEGGTMSEREIGEFFRKYIHVENITAGRERRVVNLKRAFEYVDRLAHTQEIAVESRQKTPFQLSEDLILDLHELITSGLKHPANTPGNYRDNSKHTKTVVGDSMHGGMYTPPTCLKDIRLLMTQFVQWINSEQMLGQHPLIRASLAHYYFERIHPFFDGNGRVGRVIEALLLKSSGIRHAHHALSRTYLEYGDEYFLVFNTSRKGEVNAGETTNTPFVEFSLNCLRETFFSLHARTNQYISIVLYENIVSSCYREKKINERQFTIINNLLPKGYEHPIETVRSQAWYTGMYERLTRKTRDRDLRKLVELGLISIHNKRLKLLVFRN